jgi:cytochrome b
VLAYLRDGQASEPGHSPLGGLSVVAMLLALVVQVATGLIQIDEDDFSEGPLAGQVSYDVAVLAHDVHGASFNILLALIALHLLAIGYYRFVRGRSLIWPMVTGQAELAEGVAPMQPAPTARALACAAAAFLIAGAIVAGVPAFSS